jgi:DMSO/TMAO reductase YedYZ molybdopterin-dependent catalytic subunit
MSNLLTRRAALTGLAASSATLIAGCDTVVSTPATREILFSGERFHRLLQRAITDRGALAREYRPDQMSPSFRSNGTSNPNRPEYDAAAAENFGNWKISIGGLVTRPFSLSLAQLRSMPARSQITRHDCVEGWSAIGKWHGPRLSVLLDLAGVKDSARYIVFRCADHYRGNPAPYYESVDMVDAYHPQTILAWAMNDKLLDIPHGAPVRMRIERQLGYKQAKYLTGIEAVASLDGIGQGRGGFWEDVAGYDWYGGI